MKKKTAGKEAGKKVLIAEDEKPMANALQLKLQHMGFSVDIANNGEDALNAMKEKEYDILLLDLMMPKVDGFGVLEGLKKEKIKMTVIVLTNLSQPEDEKRAKSLGAKGFYVKSNTSLAEIAEHAQKLLT